MRILVLDDEIMFLNTMRELLSNMDYDVDCVDNAKDAVTKVQTDTYDYIFVDYKLPENNGVWFMKNAKLPRHTKALLMTAYVDRDIINQMFELGACGYLIKPFDVEDLKRHLSFFSHKP